MKNFCNHLRSKEYYVESLTSKRVFNATMCYSWIDYSKRRCYRNPTAAMGAYTPNSLRQLGDLSTKIPLKLLAGYGLGGVLFKRKVLCEDEQLPAVRHVIKL
uniref:Lipase domain-containing protein n=1 Tax=Timema douglasi TaxID=61478 RepID=A0A7R8VK17_TIMDO|nr:unnamed protein product [Timema douglasi]